MIPAFALFFALLAPQAAAPATPPPTDPPAAQSSPTPTPATPSTDHAAPAIHALQIGGGVTPPKVLYQPAAAFSKEARKQKVSGVATIRLIVDAQGNPVHVQIAKSIAGTVDEKHRAAALSLDQAAVDAVMKYKFAPAMFHGKPVPVFLNVEVNFELF